MGMLNKDQERVLAEILASNFFSSKFSIFESTHNSYRILPANSKSIGFITFIYQSLIDSIWFNIQVVHYLKNDEDISSHTSNYQIENISYLICKKINEFFSGGEPLVEFPIVIKGSPKDLKKWNKLLSDASRKKDKNVHRDSSTDS